MILHEQRGLPLQAGAIALALERRGFGHKVFRLLIDPRLQVRQRLLPMMPAVRQQSLGARLRMPGHHGRIHVLVYVGEIAVQKERHVHAQARRAEGAPRKRHGVVPQTWTWAFFPTGCSWNIV